MLSAIRRVRTIDHGLTRLGGRFGDEEEQKDEHEAAFRAGLDRGRPEEGYQRIVCGHQDQQLNEGQTGPRSGHSGRVSEEDGRVPTR